MSEFQDKVVLITGAGKGFGRRIAETFGSHGAIIAANDITPINLDDTIQAITSQGGRAKSYVTDISKKMPFQSMVNKILEDWGRIDILVTNARVVPTAPILDMDEWDWNRTVGVNLTGTFLAVQIVGRVMRVGGGGNMILVLSPEDNPMYQAAYQASMAGIEALTASAAQELAPFHIRVNAVYPKDNVSEDFPNQVLGLCSSKTM